MESLPLTRAAPFEEFPVNAGMEPLFAEPASPGRRPVEVSVTIPGENSQRVVMHIVVAEADAARAFGIAFRECKGVEGFEITARRFAG